MPDLRDRLHDVDQQLEAPLLWSSIDERVRSRGASSVLPPADPARRRPGWQRIVTIAAAFLIAGLAFGWVVRSLTNSEDRPARPSPNGTASVKRWFQDARGRITVNASDGSIAAVDPSGGVPDARLRMPGLPSGWLVPHDWSADGSALLLSLPRDTSCPRGQHCRNGDGLAVLTDDGRLTRLPGTKFLDWGSLDPDGTTVVYQHLGGLNEMNVDGTGNRVVAAGGPIRNHVPHRPTLLDPAWSPGGDSIAFFELDEGGRTSISVMDPDGADRHVLVPLPRRRYTEVGWLAWSPDGSRLAFALNTCKTCARLWVVNADGTALHRISTPGDAVSPVWSPDGTRLAFIGRSGGAIVEADGSITDLGFYARLPQMAWNPVPRSGA
jgi:WD40-like Beta Propeller Repeat